MDNTTPVPKILNILSSIFPNQELIPYVVDKEQHYKYLSSCHIFTEACAVYEDQTGVIGFFQWMRVNCKHRFFILILFSNVHAH